MRKMILFLSLLLVLCMSQTVVAKEEGAKVWLLQKTGKLPALKKGEVIKVNKKTFTVKIGKREGEVNKDKCLINLSNVTKDVKIDIKNSYSSVFRSSGKKLPGITGKRITHYKNNKLVPIYYPTAMKIKKAADYISEKGYRLKVIDGYRPTSAQKALNNSFSRLINSNKTVLKGIGENEGWGRRWFLAYGVSSHSMGIAVDVTLQHKSGGDWIDCEMPTKIHELSTKAKLTNSPKATGTVSKSNYCKAVKKNTACMLLHKAFRSVGMYDLASEWWHFQDGTASKGSMNKVYKLIGYKKGLNFIAR